VNKIIKPIEWAFTLSPFNWVIMLASLYRSLL